MISYIISIFNHFFNKNPENEDEDDNYKEDFLAEQLVDLEISSDDIENETVNVPLPKDIVCYQRTGVITYVGENYVLIDGMSYFDTSACTFNLNVSDKVLYLCYKDTNESVIVVRILENQGIFWGDDDQLEETSYKIIEHVIIGEVDYRQERYVYMKDSDFKFSLDDVEATFVPVKGDWLEFKCTVQFDNDKPSDITTEQVLQVISFKALRTMVKNAVVTDWFGDFGICDRIIYFDKQSFQNDVGLQVGSKMLVEAVESNQGTCTWRAIKVILLEMNSIGTVTSDDLNIEQLSFNVEKAKNIELTYPLKFENVNFQKTAQITINITNNSDQVHIMNKWMILSKKRDSQVNVKPFLTRPMKLNPGQTFHFTVTCQPKFVGHAKECFLILFKGFQVKRFIEISVVDNFLSNPIQSSGNGHNGLETELKKTEKLRLLRKIENKSVIPGVRPVKPPAFIPVKLGAFPIPEKLWNAVLGDSEQTIHTSEYDKILERIETKLPCLVVDLNINNYTDKWRTLVYMEEIQANINMRAHDMSKVFLIRCQEYLCIEIVGISEKRPSLIIGDRAIVKDAWDANPVSYEGYIHAIKGDLVLMKFNREFHETYSGSDVSIEFHFSRSIYRKCHQAINLALSNLGHDILFPSRISTRTLQIPSQKLETINWFNDKLNSGQKAAVTNILAGVCRPLPYCIFGPPGTGKTVTVIETILQILTFLPDSRILVATPSNSAANLITERLIAQRNVFSDSVIRLIANYLVDSDNIPEIIKPFCATLDIAREESVKSSYYVKDGINMNCQRSFIGRHRVTIGTCYCLGTLAQVGLPRGHFTHVIVDEAGQATEPEIMIPMTFIDKANGQLILAGDPMQLGPIVVSKYCKEFGMEESYLSRILETYPYQRDFASFKDGYNGKLITKLNDNYRSLEEILKLPSEMFYDASLVAKIDRNEQWITNMLNIVSEVFDSSDSKTGGIFVYGIRSCNLRAEDSPSWFNPQEASMVALTVCKLYKKGISPDDIGVITPYIAQIKYLRLLFDAMGLQQTKIGTVEEFQGQERPLVLISTVRSTEAYLHQDQRHTLGFVKNPKRLNVALTRAQAAVLLFCNPHLLSLDPLWKKVIDYAIKADKYTGCDLPCVFNDKS